MDEIFKRVAGDGSAAMGVFQIPQLLLSLCISFVLCLVFAYTYRRTHQGLSYSATFVHALVLMGVTVAVIMMIVGSNIARAFSLVGALSIIRFRSAIKDPRDVAFLFMSIAVGMAVGTGFYTVATIFTGFSCAMVYLMTRLNVGAMPTREVMLKIMLPEGSDYRTAFDSAFARYLREHTLLSIENVRGASLLELVYSVVLKKETRESELIDALRACNGNNRVSLLTGADNITI